VYFEFGQRGSGPILAARSTSQKTGLRDFIKEESSQRGLDFLVARQWLALGQFIAVGLQRVFMIAPGILNPNARNTLAIAATTDGDAKGVHEPLRLVTMSAARGGVPVTMVAAPDYHAWRKDQ
jgi:hypothetical protein